MEPDLEKAELGKETATDDTASNACPTVSRVTSRTDIERVNSQNGYGVFEETDENSNEEKAPVPQSDKDPYEVGWDNGDNDPMCPRSFNKTRKWLIVIIVSFASFCVTGASSIYTTTYAQMQAEFGNSEIVSILGLSFFVLGIAFGPMFLGPMSEFWGRRPIYLVTWSLYVIWIIPQAVSQNIQTMIVSRFLDGFSGSAFLAVSGGTVGDLFARQELQLPMAMFSVSPFIGPSIGPVIGGFINYNTDWRWTYYVLIMWSAGILIALVLFVPETYHPIVLAKKAKKIRKETGDERWKAPTEKVNKSVASALGHSLLRPFQLLFLEPMITLLCLYSALLLGILYLLFGAIPLVFESVYGFNLWQSGLAFLGIGIGMIIAIATDPIWHRIRDRLMANLEKETGVPGASEPEFRLPSSILGSFLVPAGMFMFGWSLYPWVHWIVPIIGTTIFGCGVLVRLPVCHILVKSIMIRKISQQKEPEAQEPDQNETGKDAPTPHRPPLVTPLSESLVGDHFAHIPIVVTALHSLTSDVSSTIFVFTSIFTFKVDAYPTYAASALAANAFVRCTFAAAFPLFGQQMYKTLGYHWATSLLAFLTLAMVPFPYLFFKYGKTLREKSRFAKS